jgi:hypothetical protein
MEPLLVLALSASVCLAFTIEAALGFGATLVAVSLGALIMPIPALLAAFVPVNLVLSSVIAVRERAHVDRRLLFARVLPLMAIGVPIGMLAVRELDARGMKLVFGAFVTILAAVELLAEIRRRPNEGSIGRASSTFMLVLGGAFHGAFATGGPMAVYVIGRAILDKAAFRATLSLLWVCLNALLLAAYAHEGTLGRASLATSALLLPPLAIGLAAGDGLHRLVPLPAFRVAVFVMLAIVGVAVALRAW